MPTLPPTPVMSLPKVVSTSANTDVVCETLKKFTPAETSPQTSWRLYFTLDRARNGPATAAVASCHPIPCPLSLGEESAKISDDDCRSPRTASLLEVSC